MSEREQEPIFCTECQNEVKVEDARTLDGRVLCRADLGRRPFLERLRARKLPQNVRRRSGKTFQSLFTSIAMLMLVVGASLVWQKDRLVSGVWMIVGSVLVALFAMFAADVIDLLLDILDQLKERRH